MKITPGSYIYLYIYIYIYIERERERERVPCAFEQILSDTRKEEKH